MQFTNCRITELGVSNYLKDVNRTGFYYQVCHIKFLTFLHLTCFFLREVKISIVFSTPMPHLVLVMLNSRYLFICLKIGELCKFSNCTKRENRRFCSRQVNNQKHLETQLKFLFLWIKSI